MHSEGASGLVNLGDVDFDSLALQDLQALDYQDERVDGNDDPTNQLVPGVVFAVETSDGNFAKAQVLTYGYNLELRFVAFNGQTGGRHEGHIQAHADEAPPSSGRPPSECGRPGRLGQSWVPWTWVS